MVKVSIIIPIFRCERRYLTRCIDSILNQTLSDLEIILACDGGDEDFQICDEYAQKDNRVVVLKNCGSYGKSVNTAIKQAKGEYIGIVEGDDWCLPTMYKKLYRCVQKYNSPDVVRAAWLYAFDDPSKNIDQRLECNENLINIYSHPNFLSFIPSVWSAIYKKEFLLDNSILFMEEKQSYIDVPFHYETFYKAQDYILLDEPLYCYYQDNPSQSVKSSKNIYDVLNAEKYAYKKIRQINGLWDKIKEYYIKSFIGHMCWNERRIPSETDKKLFEEKLQDFTNEIQITNFDFTSVSDEDLRIFSKIINQKLRKKNILVKSYTFRLFGLLPLLKIKKYEHIVLCKICSLIPFFKYVKTEKFISLNVFCIPIFKIKVKK